MAFFIGPVHCRVCRVLDHRCAHAVLCITPPENIVMVFVTHGLNMVAAILEKKKVFLKDIWKPILYTTLYNTFLAIYVGGGGRSISGKLPYWYAQYDQPIGWVFGGPGSGRHGYYALYHRGPRTHTNI